MKRDESDPLATDGGRVIEATRQGGLRIANTRTDDDIDEKSVEQGNGLRVGAGTNSI